MPTSQLPQKYIPILKDIFYRYGFRSPSMKDIAKELGISKKTLYKFVSNKAELVDVILQSIITQYENKLSSVAIDDNQLFNTSSIVLEFWQQVNAKAEKDLSIHYPKSYERFKEFSNRFQPLFLQLFQTQNPQPSQLANLHTQFYLILLKSLIQVKPRTNSISQRLSQLIDYHIK